MSKKKLIGLVILVILIPLITVAGALLFDEKLYSWISLIVAIVGCVPFFLSFENKLTSTKKLVIIAVMIALCIVGRLIFAPIPGFKPITAMVIITAMYFGSEAGFLTGALTALVSNFYFGQGPWTPFQMLVWGLIGLLAGIFAKWLKDKTIIMLIFGGACGVVFSLLMDVWTVLWADGTFNIIRYLAVIATAVPVTVEYSVSNIIFLLILAKPLGKKLQRVCTKYGIN